MRNLGILISGRGSNMGAILRAVRRREIPIRPAIVISNRPGAEGLEVARRMGVRTEVVDSGGFRGSRWQYDRRVVRVLMENGVTPRNGLVCLAGFMRIISPRFVSEYRNRIMNIHPSLLPAFPGLNAQRQALEHGAKYSGCTVHFVDAGTDTGPIIVQSAVRIREGDTEETLSGRILRQEHRIYPEAVDLFARNRITIRDGRTFIGSP